MASSLTSSALTIGNYRMTSVKSGIIAVPDGASISSYTNVSGDIGSIGFFTCNDKVEVRAASGTWKWMRLALSGGGSEYCDLGEGTSFGKLLPNVNKNFLWCYRIS